MPFRINYKFKDDDNYYTCLVTEEQFQNFQALPAIEICMKDKEVHDDVNNNMEDVEVALDLAKNNDTSKMKKLSDVISE
ncbi:hypothetical protein [Nitrosopumilus sp.]|uniref:hypothetical protein n=1 Tax=Nitrosopumilus sp. TaxID=2024843 RepID=UPI00260D753D|nr:hypothetical protein [Nitrosopumilus sp.]